MVIFAPRFPWAPGVHVSSHVQLPGEVVESPFVRRAQALSILLCAERRAVKQQSSDEKDPCTRHRERPP